MREKRRRGVERAQSALAQLARSSRQQNYDCEYSMHFNSCKDVIVACVANNIVGEPPGYHDS